MKRKPKKLELNRETLRDVTAAEPDMQEVGTVLLTGAISGATACLSCGGSCANTICTCPAASCPAFYCSGNTCTCQNC